MKIALISDTHDNIENINKVLNIIKEKQITTILHAGDISFPNTLELFKGFKLHFVLGNCDTEILAFDKITKENNFQLLGSTGIINLENKKIGITHGNSSESVENLLKQNLDYLILGHQHLHSDTQSGNTRIINPGSVKGDREKPHFAILDLTNDILEFITI